MLVSIRMAACAIGITAVLALPAFAADRDWNGVGKALGKAGAMQPGGVYKVALPRTDLHVTLDGVALKPGFALGGWLAFEPVGDSTMVMGDVVLTQDEIAPVMKTLEEDGIQITGLHNHLLRAEPATMYMHVLGHGDPIKLARALHDGLALSGTPLGVPPGAAPAPQGSGLDKAAIDRALGATGKENGGVLQYSFPRAEKVEDAGMPVPPAMGSATGINFQPTSGGKAAITGDFVLIAQEVNPVAKALRENGIEVTAVHNHMLQDQPRLFFLHFWANDEAQKLAKGLRTALNAVDIKKSRQ
jgi:biotin operon repressor